MLRLQRERERAARLGLRLDVERTGDLSLNADREAILLALSNLVSNAIDWSPPEGRIAVSLDGDGDRVQVSVDDEGSGVPEDLREKIFTPFFSAKPADGRRQGYGLGLALARAAVEAMGGTVEALSSPSGGARFCMSLPRVAAVRPA